MQGSIRAARLVAYVTLLVLVAGGTAAAQPGQDQADRHGSTVLPARPLPLGPADLPEERITRRLEPGLVHTKIVRGHSSDTRYSHLDAAVRILRDLCQEYMSGRA